MEVAMSLLVVTIVPSFVILPICGQTISMESLKLLFEWALTDHYMTFGVDKLCYSLKEVKYCHLG